MVSLRKFQTGKIEVVSQSGNVVGSATVEKIGTGYITHLDMAGKGPDILREGFTLREEKNGE